jgi:hypothetical protein
VSKYSAYGLRIDMTTEGPDRHVIETASGSVITTVSDFIATEDGIPQFSMTESPSVTFHGTGKNALKRAKEVFPTKHGVQPKERA